MIAGAVPSPSHPGWKRRDYAEQAGRLGQLQRTGFEDVAPALRWLLAELNGLAFLDFLGALTGRRDLIGDPHYTGAGPLGDAAGRPPRGARGLQPRQRAPPRSSPQRPLLRAAHLGRRVGRRARAVGSRAGAVRGEDPPLRDRLVVMAYGEDHWHGHPEPVRCPAGHARVVIAAYYYAARAAAGDDDGAHGARWA